MLPVEDIADNGLLANSDHTLGQHFSDGLCPRQLETQHW